MIKPIENNKKRKKPQGPTPQPEWAEAFMVLLLAKTGGSATLSFERLKEFSKIKGCKATEISFDYEKKTVTVSLPKIEMPNIEVITNKIITLN